MVVNIISESILDIQVELSSRQSDICTVEVQAEGKI